MRVIVADDSALIREGLVRLLREAGFEITAQATDAEELLSRVHADPPDVVIVDIRMPPTHTDEGIRAAWEIRADHPQVGVLVLSQYASTTYALKLLSKGSERLGYLVKDRVSQIEDLADAVRRVAAGESVIDPDIVARLLDRRRQPGPMERLTVREREVLGLLAEGRSNRAICDRLHISLKTLSSHISSIFAKLDLSPADEDHRRVLAVLTYLRSEE